MTEAGMFDLTDWRPLIGRWQRDGACTRQPTGHQRSIHTIHTPPSINQSFITQQFLIDLLLPLLTALQSC
jgi:hypothetical protein